MRASVLATIFAFGTVIALPAQAQQSTDHPANNRCRMKRIKELRLATPESPDMWENKKGPALLAMFPVNRIRKAARQRRVRAVRPAKPAEKLEA
jgi:hypothetical protein